MDKPCHILSINETRLNETIGDGFVKINGYGISVLIETEEVELLCM